MGRAAQTLRAMLGNVQFLAQHASARWQAALPGASRPIPACARMHWMWQVTFAASTTRSVCSFVAVFLLGHLFMQAPKQPFGQKYRQAAKPGQPV